MQALRITAWGQVTFRKDIAKHLGIKPGEKVEVEVLPGGKVGLRAEQSHRAGGDFADGAIAYEGKWLGGEAFVSSNKRAVA